MVLGVRHLLIFIAFLSAVFLAVAIFLVWPSRTDASVCGSAGTAVFPDQDPFDPQISIWFLDAMDIGDCEEVTIYVRDITTINETFRVKMTTNSKLAFNERCSDRSETSEELTGESWYRIDIAVYGCRAGDGTMTAELQHNGLFVTDDDVTVTVTDPSPPLDRVTRGQLSMRVRAPHAAYRRIPRRE